jgi:hypothetical protein
MQPPPRGERLTEWKRTEQTPGRCAMTTRQIGRAMPTPHASDAGEFRLEVLELLPCGCVVAVQRMAQSGVRVVSMEAKGPHCLYDEHRANKVIRLGDLPDPLDDDYIEEGVRVA